MNVTRKDLDQLEYYVTDAVHPYGFEVTRDVLFAMYQWCNRICPGYAAGYGCWPPPSLIVK